MLIPKYLEEISEIIETFKNNEEAKINCLDKRGEEFNGGLVYYRRILWLSN